MPPLLTIILSYQNKLFMSALFLLVAVSIAVAGFFLTAFIWSVKSNQFEDYKGASMRMLYDDEVQKNIFQ